MNNCFPKDYRIRKRQEYRNLQSFGVRRSTKHFTLLIIINNNNCVRLGITASRKVGGAVERNRVKRLLREFFRSSRSCFPQGIDVCVIARRGAHKLDLFGVERELLPIVLSIQDRKNA